ncbi:MAG: hypothetical protein ACFFDK_08530, partial [Promethearchaeota archaeon]
QSKRPKIWIWSGSNANIQDKYIAGASATKIKSKEKLYGASIEVVEDGSEPENFPIISEEKIITSLEKVDLKEREKIEIEVSINAEEKVNTTEGLKIDASEGDTLEGDDPILILKEQLKVFLKDISENLTDVIVKIKNFSKKL